MIERELLTFKLSGNGYPIVFFVYELSDKSPDPIWQIQPDGDSPLQKAYELPPIIYGKIPYRWKQIIPKDGEPLPLQAGKTYSVSSPSNSANTRAAVFTIREGQVRILEGS